jgi:hypothetical protein
LFSHAANFFLEFANKSTQIDCILFELWKKQLKFTAFLFCHAAKSYGICEQKQLQLTAFLFCYAAKSYGTWEQKQLKLSRF